MLSFYLFFFFLFFFFSSRRRHTRCALVTGVQTCALPICHGSITAFYTVLTEGDDYRHDPIADAARAILDGQVVLSRDLAEAAHFPAIDLEGSVSRAMDAIVPKLHLQSAQRLRQLVSAYRQQRDLIAVGAYQKGSDPRVDEAIARWPEISAFLQQSVDERSTLAAAVSALDKVLAVTPGVRT